MNRLKEEALYRLNLLKEQRVKASFDFCTLMSETNCMCICEKDYIFKEKIGVIYPISEAKFKYAEEIIKSASVRYGIFPYWAMVNSCKESNKLMSVLFVCSDSELWESERASLKSKKPTVYTFDGETGAESFMQIAYGVYNGGTVRIV